VICITLFHSCVAIWGNTAPYLCSSTILLASGERGLETFIALQCRIICSERKKCGLHSSDVVEQLLGFYKEKGLLRANGLCNITQATSPKAFLKSNSCDLLLDTFYDFVDMTSI